MKVNIRSDSVEISGYVNAVGRESRVLHDDGGYFTEIIEPGAFARALMTGKRQMLLNHDKGRVIGEEGDNLELTEDAVGLYARATVTDPEVVEKARKRELRGWSFGFRPLRQSRSESGGMERRTVQDMVLSEVSIIDQRAVPCYAATSVFTRADDGSEPVECRAMEFDAVHTVEEKEPEPEPPDLSAYRAVLDELESVTH